MPGDGSFVKSFVIRIAVLLRFDAASLGDYTLKGPLDQETWST